MTAAPVRCLAHALFGQMQPDACFGRQRGIIGDQQGRDTEQPVCQRLTRPRIARTHHHQAAARQGTCRRGPVGVAVIGHQHQGHVGVESGLVIE